MITMTKDTSLVLAAGKEEAEELQRQFFAHEFAGWESTLLVNVSPIRSAPQMFGLAAGSSCLLTGTQGSMPAGSIPQGAELGPATSTWGLTLTLRALLLALATQDLSTGLKPEFRLLHG